MNGHLAVIGILRTDGPVGQYIGGSGVNVARVFPGEPEQGTPYPLIRVEVFDSEAFDSASGAAWVDHEIVKVFIDGEDETILSNLAVLCRKALEEKSGTFNGVAIENIRFMRRDTYPAGLTNKVVRTHECDYEVRVINN